MKIKISEKIKKRTTNNPKEVAKILQDVLKAEPRGEQMKEHFWGVYLNSRNNIIKVELISLGIIDANLVHPRETYAPALESRASSLVVSHNHPSGNPEPSEADITMTSRLKKAGEILGVELKDHIIITKEKFYSFKENNLI